MFALVERIFVPRRPPKTVRSGYVECDGGSFVGKSWRPAVWIQECSIRARTVARKMLNTTTAVLSFFCVRKPVPSRMIVIIIIISVAVLSRRACTVRSRARPSAAQKPDAEFAVWQTSFLRPAVVNNRRRTYPFDNIYGIVYIHIHAYEHIRVLLHYGLQGARRTMCPDSQNANGAREEKPTRTWRFTTRGPRKIAL